MQNRKTSSRTRRALKISSQHVGRWIVRPLVQVIERESLKLERFIERTQFESQTRQLAIRDEILAKLAEIDGSIDTAAREMESGKGGRSEPEASS